MCTHNVAISAVFVMVRENVMLGLVGDTNTLAEI